ncbi:MAG: hypothetical protein ACFE0O_10625 [Opitutales bacterium]
MAYVIDFDSDTDSDTDENAVITPPLINAASSSVQGGGMKEAFADAFGLGLKQEQGDVNL